VAMRITTACRQSEVGLATVRKKLRFDIHGVALAKQHASVKALGDHPTPILP
jgi:hypothetical protein